MFQRVLVDDIGLETCSDSPGKQHVGENLTPNPTLSLTELQLLRLFRMLSAEKQRGHFDELTRIIDHEE